MVLSNLYTSFLRKMALFKPNMRGLRRQAFCRARPGSECLYLSCLPPRSKSWAENIKSRGWFKLLGGENEFQLTVLHVELKMVSKRCTRSLKSSISILFETQLAPVAKRLPAPTIIGNCEKKICEMAFFYISIKSTYSCGIVQNRLPINSMGVVVLIKLVKRLVCY